MGLNLGALVLLCVLALATAAPSNATLGTYLLEPPRAVEPYQCFFFRLPQLLGDGDFSVQSLRRFSELHVFLAFIPPLFLLFPLNFICHLAQVIRNRLDALNLGLP